MIIGLGLLGITMRSLPVANNSTITRQYNEVHRMRKRLPGILANRERRIGSIVGIPTVHILTGIPGRDIIAGKFGSGLSSFIAMAS
jgi:hypothetical protein